jgi:hypothetical protein
MDLEQVQACIDAVNETELTGEPVEDTDATVGVAAGAFGKLIVNVAGSEHRLVAAAQIGLIQSAIDPAFGVVQALVYGRIHLKTLVSVVREKRSNLSNTMKCRGFSCFPIIALC